MNWYSKVSKDLSQLPYCLEYFFSELSDAKVEVKIHGSIEKASSHLPGIVEHRFNQLQEIEAILKYLNIELNRVRSQKFRQYLENYNRELSSRDCEKYVDGEADVIDMEKLVNEFALVRNHWNGIIKGLEVKSYQLNNIIRLRVAGLEDIIL
jgi:hypothetical protein